MNIGIRGIPFTANDWQVTKELAKVIHSDEFHPTFDKEHPERTLLLNFLVKVNLNEKLNSSRNDGSATLTVPTMDIGKKFLYWVKDHPIRMPGEDGKPSKLRFSRAGHCAEHVALTLQRKPFADPDVEIERAEILQKLSCSLRVDTVQFGVFYHSQYVANGTIPSREFSIEWEHDYIKDSQSAWLHFDHDQKLIRLTVGNETRDNQGFDIKVTFSSIKKMGGGYDGKPYICFDTFTPPIFEAINFYNDYSDKSKHRVGDIGHSAVAAYARQLRILLFNYDKPLEMFKSLCRDAGLGSKFRIFKDGMGIEATGRRKYFSGKSLAKLRRDIKAFDWPVAFQLEALLSNGLLHTEDINGLLPRLRDLCRRTSSTYAGDLLRFYSVALDERPQPGRESPLSCFERAEKEMSERSQQLSKLSSGHFACGHVTFTPTRLILEGPYATQSNRVIRQFAGYEHHFLRVDFRDEDRLNYRWDRTVDGATFVRQRVGGVLKHGFLLGGRSFEFLAYSSSALREHAVWFISPFNHPVHGRVDAESIRHSVGDFRGKLIMKQPSKWAARIGQAFTATDPSVRIRREQWEQIDDIGNTPHLHTDGAGTISQSLADEIWSALCKDRRDQGANSVKPSAFQIRFLGFKGVVAVDRELDKHPDGIRMRLRDSMRKFDVENEDEADIEIARAFDKPNQAYLNRALVMVLEDKNVPPAAFQYLQEAAIANALTIDDSLELFRTVLSAHGLGNGFRLSSLLKNIESLGFDLKAHQRTPSIDTPFLQQLRQVAKIDVLREIKHQARIPIPEGYKLVGVPDEGPTYQGLAGYRDVFCLPEGQIAACIQENPSEQPTWLEGRCTISRSPIAHPGDVQSVFAVKPPKDKFCAFAHLINVVILPSVGRRSLASCLGGGDLDGDQYDVIMHPDLLPPTKHEAAEYPAGDTYKVTDEEGNPRECTVDDICDFIVEYINSDVLGLLSDRLLIIADQSKKGIHDEDCAKLAALCSQAVDYPKNGIPVDIDNNNLPRTLIRCKPDWHAAEVVDPRSTDYYRSTKVLGHLYRMIEWKEPEVNVSDRTPKSHVMVDPLSLTLRVYIERELDDYVDPDGTSHLIAKTFRRYADELRYVCVTHTLSNTSEKLLEAEVVVGTIMAKCTQRRWRKDRMWKMRIHASQLVRDVKRSLFPIQGPAEDIPPTEIRAGLKRAWEAWDFSLRNSKDFGAQSFGLVGLDVVFDCLERLGVDMSFKKIK